MQRALAISVVAATVLAAMVLAACGGEPDAQRIQDPQFVRAAGAECGRAIPPLRPDLHDKSPKKESEVAATVDDRATRLHDLVSVLRGLPVTTDAQSAVGAWLADWDAYVDLGHRYATALRGGDPKVQARVASEATAPLRRISAFARANGMPACALDLVPLPKRESPL
jgi:hypothetical protein